MNMKYEYHDLLLWTDVADEPYESLPSVAGGPVVCIPQPWAQVLDKSGLLGLINMPHFGRLNEVNACVKQLLACFHGGMLWLDTPITLTVYFISEIMGLPKDGPDPSQYLKGRDNDKRLKARLKERYDLQCDGRAYHIDIINDRVVCIGAQILESNIIRKNHPI